MAGPMKIAGAGGFRKASEKTRPSIIDFAYSREYLLQNH